MLILEFWFYYQKEWTSPLRGTSRVLKAALADGSIQSCFDIYSNPATPLNNFYFWDKNLEIYGRAHSAYYTLCIFGLASFFSFTEDITKQNSIQKVILISPLPIQILSVLHDSTFNCVWP